MLQNNTTFRFSSLVYGLYALLIFQMYTESWDSSILNQFTFVAEKFSSAYRPFTSEENIKVVFFCNPQKSYHVLGFF